MNTKLHYLFVLLLIPFSSISQQSFSLAEAQAFAIENAYAVKYAHMDADAAQREVKAILSRGMPQVNGSVEYNNFIDIPTQVAPADAFGFPDYLNQFLFNVAQETGVALNAPEADPDAISELQFGADQTLTAGVTATQLVFDGSYFVGVQAAKAYAKALEGSILQTELETKKLVADAYYMALTADENIEILSQSLDVIAKTVIETEALYESGFVEELDVDQLKLTRSDILARINYAKSQKTVAYRLLKFQMGMDLNKDITLSDDVDALTVDANTGTLTSQPFVPENNVSVKVQNEYLQLSQLNLKNEKMNGLPSVGAFYTYSSNAQRSKFDFFDGDQNWYPTQLWGVQMNVPIFGSGLRRHNVEKAKIELSRAETALNQISNAVTLEYESAKVEYDNALETYRIQKDNLTIAEKILDKTKIKYQEGVSSSFELTQSQNQLLTTQGNYIGAMLNLLQSKARLSQALNNY